MIIYRNEFSPTSWSPLYIYTTGKYILFLISTVELLDNTVSSIQRACHILLIQWLALIPYQKLFSLCRYINYQHTYISYQQSVYLPQQPTTTIPSKQITNSIQHIISVHPLFLIGPLKVGSYSRGFPVKYNKQWVNRNDRELYLQNTTRSPIVGHDYELYLQNTTRSPIRPKKLKHFYYISSLLSKARVINPKLKMNVRS